MSQMSSSKSARITVDPDQQDDPFYRYWMPPVQIKPESGGNGSKIVLTNLPTIACSLARSPESLLHFLKVEFGASSKVTCGKYILMGRTNTHNEAVFQTAIYKFIVNYVLCSRCRKPETVVRPGKKKKSAPTLDCSACGFSGEVENTATAKQLAREGETMLDELAAGRAALEKHFDELAAEASMLPCGGLTDLSSSVPTDTSQVSSVESKVEIEDEEATVTAELKQLLQSDSLLPSVETFRDTVSDIRLSKPSVEDKTLVKLIFEVLFTVDTPLEVMQTTQSGKVPTALTERILLLKCFTRTGTERMLLNSVLRWANKNEKFHSKAPVLIEQLYEEEVVSEEDILEWFDANRAIPGLSKEKRKLLREKVKPIIDWLKEE